MAFNFKDWTYSILVSDVKNRRISKSQAAYWINMYVLKGIFTVDDVQHFEDNTREAEPVESGDEV